MLQKIEQLEREVEKLVVDIQQNAWNHTEEIKRTVGNNNPKEILDWQQTTKRLLVLESNKQIKETIHPNSSHTNRRTMGYKDTNKNRSFCKTSGENLQT